MRYIISLLLVVLIGALSATTIYDIQYTTNVGDGTYPSTMVGQTVTVEGIVTANYMQGEKFFISEPQGGPWRGIFVYEWATLPAVGDLVSVTGTVAEYNGVTEITYATVTILSSGNPLPPITLVTTGSLMSGITGEQYEGVYIGVSRVTVSSSVETIGYNQYGINDGTGECLVDDDMYDSTQVTVGQTMDIVGICHYSYDHYKVFPRTAQDIRPYGTSNSKKSWGRIKSIYR